MEEREGCYSFVLSRTPHEKILLFYSMLFYFDNRFGANEYLLIAQDVVGLRTTACDGW
jgi:hypothetical protein